MNKKKVDYVIVMHSSVKRLIGGGGMTHSSLEASHWSAGEKVLTQYTECKICGRGRAGRGLGCFQPFYGYFYLSYVPYRACMVILITTTLDNN